MESRQGFYETTLSIREGIGDFMSSSPYMILFLAIFVAGFFLAITIFFMRKIIDGKKDKGRDEYLATMLNSIQKEINDIRVKQEAEGRRVQKELVESFMKSQEALQKGVDGGIRMMMENMSTMSGSMTDQLAKTQKSVTDQLSVVKTTLGGLSESARRMQEIGHDISKLQELLRSPKLRGNIGEVMLEDMLRQVLPSENYHLQYRFRSGEKVDAAIVIGDNIIPVDSKFPLESFSRLAGAEEEAGRKSLKREFVSSVKKKIDDIAEKYIKPEEGTYDFALMYVPAENVYYEIIIREDGSQGSLDVYSYCLSKKVIPVSPNSFYAYIVAIAFGLKGFKIEKEAIEIRGRLGELQKGVEKFWSVFDGLGKNINIASRKYDDARKKLENLDNKIELITGVKGELPREEE